MKKNHKIIAALVIGAVALPFVTACDDQDEMSESDPIELRLAHVVNEEDSFHIAAVRFQELVEERTDGTVSVELFPNAQLGDERTLLEGMQIGTVDMGVITNGPVANFVEEIAVFELPFLFPNREAAYEVLDGAVGQDLLDELERVDLKGLAYAERGFRNLTNSRGPVAEPADLDGLRLRVMENPVYVDTFRELGANAVPMAWTEALSAMQQGTIDGQENPVNVIHSFELNETQSHMTLSRHTYAPAIFVMGLSKWQELPSEVQVIVQEAAQAASAHAREQNAEMEADQLADLEDSGMAVVHDPDLEAFQAAVAPVYEKYSDRFGEYLERIQEQLE